MNASPRQNRARPARPLVRSRTSDHWPIAGRAVLAGLLGVLLCAPPVGAQSMPGMAPSDTPPAPGMSKKSPAMPGGGGASAGDHAAHHPDQQPAKAGAPSKPVAGGMPDKAGGMGGKTGGDAGGGMMGGMAKMMEGMGTPPQKELYPSLMDLPELSPEKRAEIEKQADERMKAGSGRLSHAVEKLHAGIESEDYAALEDAKEQIREAQAQFESGLAARRALAEGKPPRIMALEWFKQEMNLASPRRSEESHPAGVTLFHLFTMGLLIAFAFAMVAMYFFKMRRAADLFGRIEPDPAAPPPGSAKPLAEAKPPDGKKPAPDDKPAAPTDKSDKPAVADKPAAPADKPVAGAHEPAAPADKPAAAPDKPAAAGDKPAAPDNRLAAAAEKLAGAADKLTTVADQLAAPAGKPAAGDKAAVPADKPAAPADKPAAADKPASADKPPDQAAAAAKPAADAPPTGNAPAASVPAQKQPAATKFSCHAPAARAVLLTGTFNGWDQKATPMVKDPEGNWEAAVALPPGRYEFKFVVDGVLCCEPGCEGPHQGCPKCVPNSSGTMNRILEVS